MLKGAKTKLTETESKEVIIMPSTRHLSGFVNRIGLLGLLGFMLIGCYIAGACILIFGASYFGAGLLVGSFLFARTFDLLTKNRKKFKGYIKTDRRTASHLIAMERAYSKLNEDNKALYKNYLEGAYYGDATPEKVTEFFEEKLQQEHKAIVEVPKYIDVMIDTEMGK